MRFLNAGVEAVGNSPEEFTALIKTDVGRWSKVIKDAGIKLDLELTRFRGRFAAWVTSGHRSFETEDASCNIAPWGIFIGGEDLHNNHHAYPTSARLSSKWWEVDIGWSYIRMMEILRLARVKKIAPKVTLATAKAQCDQDTLRAVITHRYDVLAGYAGSLRRICVEEIQRLNSAQAMRIDRKLVKRWLHSNQQQLSGPEREGLRDVLSNSKVLDTVYSMRLDLIALWQRSTASKEQLVRQLEDWCNRAETSGIVPLQIFSQRLRRLN